MTESQSSLVKHQRGDGEPLEAHARAVWQAVSTFLWLPTGWAEENGLTPPANPRRKRRRPDDLFCSN